MKRCKECGDIIVKGRFCLDCKRNRITKQQYKRRKDSYMFRLMDTLGRRLRYQIAKDNPELLDRLGPKPGEEYEIDHLIPLSTASCPEEMERLNHPVNLRWLTREQNHARRYWKPTINDRINLDMLIALEGAEIEMFAASDYWGCGGVEAGIDDLLCVPIVR